MIRLTMIKGGYVMETVIGMVAALCLIAALIVRWQAKKK